MPPTTSGSTSTWRRTSCPSVAPSAAGEPFPEVVVQRRCDGTTAILRCAAAAACSAQLVERGAGRAAARRRHHGCRPARTVTGLPCRRAGRRRGRACGRRRRPRVGQRRTQRRRALDDPREPEQLVLDLVEAAGASARPRTRVCAPSISTRVDQVRAATTSAADDRAQHAEGVARRPRSPSSVSSSVTRAAGSVPGSARARPARPRARAAGRPRAGRSRPCRRSRRRPLASSASSRSRASPAPGGCARISRYRCRRGRLLASASRSAMNRSTMRRWRASSSSDSPTIRPARSTAIWPTSVRSWAHDLLALGLEPRTARARRSGRPPPGRGRSSSMIAGPRPGPPRGSGPPRPWSRRAPRWYSASAARAAPWPRDRRRAACGSSPGAPSSPA